MTNDETKSLECLQIRIQESLSHYVRSGFAFVKTSSRSAKDSPLVSSNFESFYLAFLNQLPEEERKQENCQITCLLKAAFVSLKVKNSEEVIEMFIKSERIYQDMLLALSNTERFRENFVIREFVDIEVDMEFRGFVFNEKLNALSQYNYLIYSDNLYKNKTIIQDLILDFFNQQVSQLLSKSSFSKNYVIDFAVFSSRFFYILKCAIFLIFLFKCKKYW